jgi:hypothetical protein
MANQLTARPTGFESEFLPFRVCVATDAGDSRANFMWKTKLKINELNFRNTNLVLELAETHFVTSHCKLFLNRSREFTLFNDIQK